MTTFCGKCGTKRDSRSKYCISCGEEFKAPFKEKEDEAKKPVAKEKAPFGKVKAKWLRALIVVGGVSGVVVAVLLVFWLAGSFHKEKKVDEDGEVADTDSPLFVVDQARDKAEGGDLDGAIKLLVDVIKTSPKEGVYHWYLADFYVEKGDHKLAIKTLEECYECYKDDNFWGPEALKKKEEVRRMLLRKQAEGK